MNFSIIIPHYNVAHLLSRLLDSIPSRSDVEIIVVDDCSEPQHLPLLRDIKSAHPEVLFLSTTRNSGPGPARNLGIRAAKGKFLVFADADDFFLPSISSIFDDYADSDFDIIFCNALSVDSETNLPASRVEYFPRILNNFLSTGNPDDIRVAFSVIWARLINRQFVIDNNIEFPDVAMSEDIIFSTRLGIVASRITADLRPLYCVTARENSISTILSYEAVLTRLKVAIQRDAILLDAGLSHLKGDPALLHHFLEIDRAHTPGLRRKALRICRQAGYNTWYIRRVYYRYKIGSLFNRLFRKR